jgi:hypothetical protein
MDERCINIFIIEIFTLSQCCLLHNLLMQMKGLDL